MSHSAGELMAVGVGLAMLLMASCACLGWLLDRYLLRKGR